MEVLGGGGEEGDEEDDGEGFHGGFEEKYHVLWVRLDGSVMAGSEMERL